MSNTSITAASEGLGAAQTSRRTLPPMPCGRPPPPAKPMRRARWFAVIAHLEINQPVQPPRQRLHQQQRHRLSLCAAWQPWPAGRALPGN